MVTLKTKTLKLDRVALLVVYSSCASLTIGKIPNSQALALRCLNFNTSKRHSKLSSPYDHHIRGHHRSLQVIKFLQRPSKVLINVSYPNVMSKYPVKISRQNVSSKCFVKMSLQIFLATCLFEMFYEYV